MSGSEKGQFFFFPKKGWKGLVAIKTTCMQDSDALTGHQVRSQTIAGLYPGFNALAHSSSSSKTIAGLKIRFQHAREIPALAPSAHRNQCARWSSSPATVSVLDVDYLNHDRDGRTPLIFQPGNCDSWPNDDFWCHLYRDKDGGTPMISQLGNCESSHYDDFWHHLRRGSMEMWLLLLLRE